MSQKVNRKHFVIKDKISVWNVKVGVLSPVASDHRKIKMETKVWEIKVIMN